MPGSPLGTPDNPLRVAVIGSGPSGFYATERLLNAEDLSVQVDIYDRLPTPFGLVRGGVAPDHQKIKSVTRVFDKIAAHPEFRFFGNVEVGRDIVRDEMLAYYHGIIYAVGARTDRRMWIPREHLPGSHSATDFVGWYNAHPDYRRIASTCRPERGGGWQRQRGDGRGAPAGEPAEHLAATDISDHALASLVKSQVRDIHILGRRGPAQAAFTNKEIKELGELPGVDLSSTRPRSSWTRRARPTWTPAATSPSSATWRSCAATPSASPPARRRGSSCASWCRRSRSSARAR